MKHTALGFMGVSFLAAFGIERPCSAQVREIRVRPIDESERFGFAQSRKVAVLVGVGKYPTRSRIGELKYPPRDVDLLAQVLEKQGYTVVALKDGEATREAVRNTLKDVGEVLERREGTLVFYFSGHGWEVEDKTASGLTIKRNLLATVDAGSDNLAGSGLPVDEVIERLQATRAKRRVIWIDACRNEPGRSVASRTFGTLDKAEGTRVLFATRPGRVSYENDQLQQGVFSHFLVRALRGEAGGPDGLVTYDDVAAFVSENVENFGLRVGVAQVPYEGGEYRGDFLLARNAGSSPTVVPSSVVPISPRAPVDRARQLLEKAKDAMGGAKCAAVKDMTLISEWKINGKSSGQSQWIWVAPSVTWWKTGRVATYFDGQGGWYGKPSRAMDDSTVARYKESCIDFRTFFLPSVSPCKIRHIANDTVEIIYPTARRSDVWKFDASTGLPQKYTSHQDDEFLGSQSSETRYLSFRDVDGIKVVERMESESWHGGRRFGPYLIKSDYSLVEVRFNSGIKAEDLARKTK